MPDAVTSEAWVKLQQNARVNADSAAGCGEGYVSGVGVADAKAAAPPVAAAGRSAGRLAAVATAALARSSNGRRPSKPTSKTAAAARPSGYSTLKVRDGAANTACRTLAGRGAVISST